MTCEEKISARFRGSPEPERESAAAKDLGHLRASQAAYRARNREKIAAYKTAYRTLNRAKILAAQKRHRELNQAKVLAGKAAYRAKNRERILASRRFQYANDASFRAHRKAYLQSPRVKEKRRQAQKRHYSEHPAQEIARSAAYRAALPPEEHRRINRGKRTRARRKEVSSLVARIQASVPASLPRHARDDIVGEMSLAIASRRLRKADIERRAPDFIKAYWKTYSQFTSLSLDAPAYADGPALIDTIVDESENRWS